MTNWGDRVNIKHLLTEDEDHQSVQDNMNAIADVLSNEPSFWGFSKTIAKFRKIPEGDEFFSPVDYANKLLSYMYDYADYNNIWIE